MRSQRLLRRDVTEMAQEFESFLRKIADRISRFEQKELKTWHRLNKDTWCRIHKVDEVRVPEGWQRRVLEALAGQREPLSLSALTSILEEKYGEANKSTVAVCLKNLGDSGYATPSDKGAGRQATPMGLEMARVLTDIHRSARSFAIGALKGGQRTLEQMVDSFEDWEKQFSKFERMSDSERPSAARVYDTLIGGSFNYAIDRKLVTDIEMELPSARIFAQINRAFLHFGVSHLAKNGITQFIDVGSGLPTAHNTHEIAASFCPDAKTVYVDADDSVIELGRSLLAGATDSVEFVQERFEYLGRRLQRGEFGILDLKKPVGLVLVALLHFIPEEGVLSLALENICDALPNGSMLVVTHGCRDPEMPPQALKLADDVLTYYREKTGLHVIMRSKDDLRKILKKNWTPISKSMDIRYAPEFLWSNGDADEARSESASPLLKRILANDQIQLIKDNPCLSLISGSIQTIRK